MKQTLSFAALLLALTLGFAAPSHGQYVVGITGLQLDPDFGRVYGYSATALDYVACWYYDAAVVGRLYQGAGVIDSGSYHGICEAEVFTDGFLADDQFYTEVSDHYVIAYYYYEYYGWYDPFGYSFFGSGDHGGSFNYGCYYCGGYYFAANVPLGTTRVALFNQGPCNRAPTLTGPSEVTRGQTATYTLNNVCRTGTVSNWSFSDGSTTVNRSSGTGSTTWSGTLVTGGTVRATVTQGGQTYNLSKATTIKARTNWAFPAVTPTKVSNNFVCSSTTTLSVPVPAVPGGKLGQTCLLNRYSFNYTTLGDQGPNHNFKYVTSAQPSNSSSSPQNTTIYYLIHPELENTTSDFYRSQCGTYNAATNPNGYISGAKLLSNTQAHEMGPVKGHYKQYVETQGKPENNVGVGLETMVGTPATAEADFANAAQAEATRRAQVIGNAFSFEDCNSEVTKDEACVFHGFISYSPYKPCRATSLNGQAPAHNRVELGWGDGSFNETAFRIDRRDDGVGTTWFQIGTVAANVLTYADTTVAANRAYIYRVVAVNAAGSSEASSEARVVVPAAPSTTPPTKPNGLGASVPSSSQVQLTWVDASNDETGFRIERAFPGGSWGQIATVGANTTGYLDGSVAASTTYVFRVIAYNAVGNSAPSNEVTVTTPAPAGQAPSAPCCLFVDTSYGGGSVSVYWSDTSNNEDGFILQRREQWGGDFYGVSYLGAGATYAQDWGLQPGQTYLYRVEAYNGFGSSYSEEYWVTMPYGWEF